MFNHLLPGVGKGVNVLQCGVCRSQKTVCGSQFSLSNTGVLDLKLVFRLGGKSFNLLSLLASPIILLFTSRHVFHIRIVLSFLKNFYRT